MAKIIEVMGWENFIWVSSGPQFPHPSKLAFALWGRLLSARGLYGAIMTMKLDSGEMNHWVSFIVSPICQELLEYVLRESPRMWRQEPSSSLSGRRVMIPSAEFQSLRADWQCCGW